jgi:hypothetical protein
VAFTYSSGEIVQRGDEIRYAGETGSVDLSRASRGASDSREREHPEPRDVFVDRVSLPRGPDREHIRFRDRASRRCTACGSKMAEASFAACTSHALDDAVTAGAGRVETLELGRRYGHLAALVAVA